MNLKDEKRWYNIAVIGEHLPISDDVRLRGGMSYYNSRKIHLVVISTKCTALKRNIAVENSN